MRTQTHMPATDKTPQIRFSPAGGRRGTARAPRWGRSRNPAASRSPPGLILPGGSEGLQARFLPGGGGEAEGRTAGWGAAVTQPPGQAARSGFPSPAFPRCWPLPAPHRGVTVPAPARYVSLRALCLPLTGPLCSPVCLTRSAVCGSRCLSVCTCRSAQLVSSACV